MAGIWPEPAFLRGIERRTQPWAGALMLRCTIMRAAPRAVAKRGTCATLSAQGCGDSAVITEQNLIRGHTTRHGSHRDPAFAIALRGAGSGRRRAVYLPASSKRSISAGGPGARVEVPGIPRGKEHAVAAVTLDDVATRAGVSAKTVSRVVNGERSVRQETRQRVLLAIEQLDYRPNLLARGLSGSHAYTIGLVYDNPNAYYIMAMQRGALTACDALNFGLQIRPCNSRAVGLAEELRDFASHSRLSGLVLTTPVSERTASLRRLASYQIPFVRILSAARDPRDGSPCVYVDDRDAAYAITVHLLQLGHVRIGFLRGGKHHHASAERLRGYKDALQDYGVHLCNELIIDGDYVFDAGFRGTRRLLELAEPPTAIFGCNDEIAAGALAAAQSAGLQVPYDVSIAGFEDSPFSRHSWPPLTTARQRADVIVERATRMLIAQIGGHEAENQGFSPELVVRGSTAPPRPKPRRRKRR
jgi:LacI family transcriptional regulator